MTRKEAKKIINLVWSFGVLDDEDPAHYDESSEADREIMEAVTQELSQREAKVRESVINQILSLPEMQEEALTIVGHKYGTDTGEIKNIIGDGEEEWKAPRNELRKELVEAIETLKDK